MTKQELLACRMIRAEIEDLQWRIQETRFCARDPKGINYSDASGSRDELSRQQRYVESVEQLTELYKKQLIRLIETQKAIEQAISILPPQLRILMRYRYIDGLRWDEVNQKLGEAMGKERISERTSKRMHAEALQRLQNI